MDFCGTQSQSVSKWFEEKLKKNRMHSGKTQ